MSDATDTRMSMIELDLTPPSKDASAGDPSVRAAAPLPMSTFDAPVSAGDACADLIAAEDTAMAAAGLGTASEAYARKDLYFAPGTALAQSGHDALASYDAAYRALPTLRTGLDGLRGTIASETRRDTIACMNDYRLNAEGLLARLVNGAPESKGVAVEPHAWTQLAGGVGANVNAGLTALGARKVERRVRARTVNGMRSVFAFVSSGERGYTVCDVTEASDLMLAGLADVGLADGARCEIDYDATNTSWRIRAILQAPIDIPAHAGVGRAHQIFADLSGADNGSQRIKGCIGAIRIRCLNASLSPTQGFTFSKVHRGDVTALRAAVSKIPALFAPLAEEMRSVWARAAVSHYQTADGGSLDAPEAIARLVRGEYLPTCGATEDEAISRYVAAWRAEESPASAMGIVMAAQRAAHEGWSTRWASDEIEESASRLLYQHVSVLAESGATA